MAFTPMTFGKQTGGFQPLDFNQAQSALGGSQTHLDNLRTQAQQAEQQAQQAASPLTIAGKTAQGTAGTLFDPFIKSARSGVQAIGEMFGRKTDYNETYQGIDGPQQTLQSDVYQGKTSPLMGTGEFAFNAAQVIPFEKIASIGATAAGAVAPKVAKAAAPVIKEAGGVLSKAVKPVVNPIMDYLAKRSEKKALEASVKAITPKLSSGEIEALSKTHNVVKPTFGAPRIDFSGDKAFTNVAENVKGLVRGKSAIEDVGKVKEALGKEAEMLKSQVSAADHPYTFKELQSRLNNVEEPISLRGTPFEKQIKPIKAAAIKIAQEKGGNVSGLFDARKEFDNLVEKTYPNLYESENAPMRNAITAIRNEMNNFIDENLPAGSGFKESLKKQRMFYDAIDKIATKIPDEIKKGSVFKRIINSTPFKVGAGLGVGGTVAGVGKNLVGE